VAITYEMITDFKRVAKVRSRYEPSRRALRELGFDDLCIVAERLFPFSAFVASPLILPMLAKGEVLCVMPFLRLALLYPIMVDKSSTTYCMMFGLGVKFYTEMQDGKLVVSGNTLTGVNHEDQSNQFYRYSESGLSIGETWENHQSYSRIGSPDQHSSYKHFRELTMREDRMLLGQSKIR
jgi:hypothetical protein